MNLFCKAFSMLMLCYCPVIFTQDSAVTAIDKLMSSQFKKNEPGGVVLISKGGKIVYQKAFGIASMELDVPVSDDMVFYIGSNTKQLTAVAILQLFEKGKLSLEDSLGKYVSCKPPVSQINIRQLLSHTSGLNGNGYTDSLKIPAGNTRQAEAERYAARNMAFASGSRWEYNNGNYEVLGYIIEKISGKTYEEYLREYIFQPAGMNNSYVANDEILIKKRPAGYSNGRRGILNMNLHDTQDFYASGGVLSSAADMYKWNEALKSGILLKKETLQLAFTPQKLTDGRIAPYGFGWQIENIHGSKAYRHGGAIPGFISETLYLPSEEVFVVILLNSESAMLSQALARMMAAELIGKPFRFLESSMNERYRGTYMGLYENDRGERINITEQNGKVYFQRPGGRKYEIRHSVTDQFYFEKDFLWVEFQRNQKKKISGLVFSRVGLIATSWKKTDKPVLNLSESGQQQ